MEIVKKIKSFLNKRTKLDLFLIKAGLLVLVYYCVRILFKFSPWLKPVFIFSRKVLTKLLLKMSYFVLDVFGYDVNIYKKIIWIEGSQGVKIINACLGWSMMALFIGFLLIYPGNRKSKYWFVPVGLVAITIVNSIRITGLTLLSYHNVEMMDFYHKYVFNYALYLIVFILWIYWVKKYGEKESAA